MIPEGNLFRIKALRSFDTVIKGQLGGLIESEKNLSHHGNSWIGYSARVLSNAKVSENARVSDRAIVMCRAKIRGSSLVLGTACVKA